MGEETKYLVRICGKTAMLAVSGKAGYLNCRSAGEFFASAVEKGCTKVLVQLEKCTGMDSTFLGMIAGVALKLKKSGGELLLLNLNERNRELVENLGIARLVKISEGTIDANLGDALPSASAPTSAILDAHQNLVDADSANLAKFEDVISFLKKENKA